MTNAIVSNKSPKNLAEYYPGNFDKVLVDATCSSSGRFRKDPNTIAHWSKETVSGCARRQKKILKSTIKLLRNGELLLYSTCSFSQE